MATMTTRWIYLTAVVTVFYGCQVTAQSLYADDAPLQQLTTETAPGVLFGSGQAWIVEFYASWCGHCQRFAPVWLEFANRIKSWDGVIGVATVACSQIKNAPLCRLFNVKRYPTIKFMKPDAPVNSTGFNFQGTKTPANLTAASVEFLQTLQRQGLGEDWPHLLPYRAASEIWERYPRAERAFLIAANQSEADMLMPQQVMLENHELFPRVVVGEILEEGVTGDFETRPALYSVTRDGKLLAVPSAVTKDEMSDVVAMFAEEEDEESQEHTTRPPTTTPPPYSAPRGLHQQDLESSLYYSFWVEIGAHQLFTDASFQALKTHVHVMAKYHPGSGSIVNFLNNVDNWLQDLDEPMSGRKWVNRISKMQTPAAYVPARVEWTGCEGSQEKFRGYPCSLWMTFHALTVRAFQLNGHRADFDAEEVLSSMTGYIQHFFSCRHCAEHFGRMARTMRSEVSRPSDGVMWLWRAHNKVNNRLHGDATEDPHHPKVQFPPPVSCDDCRDEDEDEEDAGGAGRYDNSTLWEEAHVFEYLKTYYGKENIIQDSPAYTFVQEHTTTNAPSPSPSTSTPGPVPPRSHTPPPRGTSPAPTSVAPSCLPKVTRWTSCSTTCGPGVSSRLSNLNQRGCESKMEMRLCNLRPCGAYFGDWVSSPERVASCPTHGATYRAARPVPMRFGNCETLASAPWRYCGMCPGKCCHPAVATWNSTAWMEVRCGPERALGQVQVHQIMSCQCEDSCPED